MAAIHPAPAPQMYGAPQQQQMGGGGPLLQQYNPSNTPGTLPYQFSMDPWYYVHNLNTPMVKERLSIGEMVLDFDMANKYDIFDDQGARLFFAGETTGFCQRNFIPADCRPFSLVMSLQQFPGIPKQGPFLKAHKDCQWTCLCANRPLMDVTDGNGARIGEIMNPWNCFDMNFMLRDNMGADVLRVHGSCCQCGLLLPHPFNAIPGCNKIVFHIEDAKTKTKVGRITHLVPGCFKNIAASSMDNYQLDFGKITEPKWKAMVLATAIFVDFRYFAGPKK